MLTIKSIDRHEDRKNRLDTKLLLTCLKRTLWRLKIRKRLESFIANSQTRSQASRLLLIAGASNCVFTVNAAVSERARKREREGERINEFEGNARSRV